MPIPSCRINTPYVYMRKQGTGATPFTLYVFIAIYEGTTISSPLVMLPTIAFMVSGTATGPTILYKYFRFDLASPPSSANPLDTPDISIEVKKVRTPAAGSYMPPAEDTDIDKYGDRQNTLLYDDADLQGPIPGDIAYNCPYIYLTNPYAIEGIENKNRSGNRANQNPSYTGRCHVPLRGCDYIAAQQPPMVNSFANGTNSLANGEQRIEIFPSAAGKTMLDPDHINCNLKEYQDNYRQVSFFEVTVAEINGPDGPPRKAKLRNRSPDTHLNGLLG